MRLIEVSLIAALVVIMVGFVLYERSQRKHLLMQRLQPFRREVQTGSSYTRRLKKELATPETQIACFGVLATVPVCWLLDLPVYALPLAFMAAGPLAWVLLRRYRLKKLRIQFAERFPEAVESLTRAVQAGIPMERALASLGDIYDGNLGERFRHLVHQLDVGVPFRNALHSFAQGLEMPDVEFFCAVLALNRESGSQLSPMLVSLSKTLNERRKVDRRLQSLTAESRAAARVLAALPIFIMGLQAFLNPSQVQFLLTDPLGRTVLIVCAGCMMSGLLLIRRMSRLLEA